MSWMELGPAFMLVGVFMAVGVLWLWWVFR